VVSKTPYCYCMLLMQPFRFKFIKIDSISVNEIKLIFQIMRFNINQKQKLRGPYFRSLRSPFQRLQFHFHLYTLPVRRRIECSTRTFLQSNVLYSSNVRPFLSSSLQFPFFSTFILPLFRLAVFKSINGK
jgi:hypothetical protein